jgi:CubicO group peptidase (beta-lactamase class C family)
MTGSFFTSGFNNVFVSTARSMARYGLLILNDGVWNGTRLMNDTSYFRQMITTSQNINESYGYLWWLNGKNSFRVPGLQTTFPGTMIPDAPADMVSGMGKNGQYLNVVKSMNLVMLRMGNAPGPGEVPFIYNDSIWVRFNDLMCSQSVQSFSSSGQQTFRIYPNPARDFLTISSSDVLKERYNIIDITGRIVLSATITATGHLQLLNLNPGIYIIRNSKGNCQRFVKE